MDVNSIGFRSSRRRHLGNDRCVGNGGGRYCKGGSRARGNSGGPISRYPVCCHITIKYGYATFTLGKPDLAVGPRLCPSNRRIAIMKNGYGRIGLVIAGRICPNVNS